MDATSNNGTFVRRNVRRRLVDSEAFQERENELRNSSSTIPRETPSLQQNVMQNNSTSSSVHVGESSRQADERTSLAPSGVLPYSGLIPDILNWPWAIPGPGTVLYNPALWETYQSSLARYSASQTRQSSAARVPAPARGGLIPIPMGPWDFSTVPVINMPESPERDPQEEVYDNSRIVDLVGDSSDVDEDMRVDVDDMSYEGLLALEDQIGTVDSGLSTETIMARLRRTKYKFLKLGPPVGDDELCAICQEDYDEDDELGKLDCGHEFHFPCIQQWLLLKNVCPICKKTALGA